MLGASLLCVDGGRGGDRRGWARYAGKITNARKGEVSGRIHAVIFAEARDHDSDMALGAAWMETEGCLLSGQME